MTSIQTCEAKVYTGLRKGYERGGGYITPERAQLQLAQYAHDRMIAFTITRTHFAYPTQPCPAAGLDRGELEEGLILGLFDSPRYPVGWTVVEQQAKDLALFCLREFEQERVYYTATGGGV